ncbi:NUDIX hydrolase domain-like protein [Nemania serpens]|nr:NUDIX hydrolase domain-like protein [Nemania serpens]
MEFLGGYSVLRLVLLIISLLHCALLRTFLCELHPATPTMANCPVFSFGYDPSVAEFTVSKQSYLAAHQDAPFDYIATSALVLDTRTASGPRILLLQRAASDEDPDKWEPAGGACDDDDESILHAAARELWEEAGLQATRIGGLVGHPYLFTLGDGKKVCRFNFAVRVSTQGEPPLAARLDPEEHQRFVWATEGEVKVKKVDGIDLDFTSAEVERTVSLAFSYFRGNPLMNAKIEEQKK